MALVGKLEDLQLAELFHLLSLFKKSGKLTLTADDATGFFYFKDGKICHASTGKPGPPLGELLVRRNLISAPELESALRYQVEEGEWRRLGTILVEKRLVSREDLDALLRERLQKVTEEFLDLKTGFFSFKPLESRHRDPEPSQKEDLELVEGINTDGFILDLLTRLDEVQRPSFAEGATAPATTAELIASDDPESASTQDLGNLLDYMIDGATIADLEEVGPTHFDAPDELSDLCSLMTEIQLRSPSYTGEIALMILRYASSVVNRGVLFHVGADGISGIGQFGLESSGLAGPSLDARVRDILIPTNEPSVFLDVAEMMQTYRGPLKPCLWNERLLKIFGGPVPDEVIAIPIVVDGMMAAVFYGDNIPKGDVIGSVKGLELLMIEAGLAMERRLLQAKLQRVEEQLHVLGQRSRSGGRSMTWIPFEEGRTWCSGIPVGCAGRGPWKREGTMTKVNVMTVDDSAAILTIIAAYLEDSEFNVDCLRARWTPGGAEVRGDQTRHRPARSDHAGAVWGRDSRPRSSPSIRKRAW